MIAKTQTWLVTGFRALQQYASNVCGGKLSVCLHPDLHVASSVRGVLDGLKLPNKQALYILPTFNIDENIYSKQL